MSWDIVGFVFFAALLLTIGPVALRSAGLAFGAKLVLAALLLRIVGTLVRHLVVFGYYEGFGDVAQYFQNGLQLASGIWAGDLEVLARDFWFGGERWVGTPFVTKLAGLVISLTGPSLLAAELFFSVLAFTGLCFYLKAFQRGTSGIVADRYAAWLWLWPSLVYWPSTINKEAVAILAMGLATYGFVGKARGIRWLPFGIGFFLAFALRPHVAAVIAIAALASRWLARVERFDLRRIVEAALFIALVAVALVAMTATFGIGDGGEDDEGRSLMEFVEFHAGQTAAGGSRIAQVPLGIAGIPFAIVNVWMRPFPWEFHNATSLVAAVEMVFLWWWVWRYRRGVGLVLREWRRSRLLTFTIPLLLAYTVMIGLTFANMGIIARQRTPLFPLLFMVLAVASLAAQPLRRLVPISEEPLQHDYRVAVP